MLQDVFILVALIILAVLAIAAFRFLWNAADYEIDESARRDVEVRANIIKILFGIPRTMYATITERNQVREQAGVPDAERQTAVQAELGAVQQMDAGLLTLIRRLSQNTRIDDETLLPPV